MRQFPFTIQLVTPETSSLLDGLDEDVFDQVLNPALLREYLSNSSNALFVALVNNKVVGMATGLTYVHPDKPRSLFINEVGVATTCQRQGIGKQLINSLLEWGKSQGCKEAWVATEPDNFAARSLYETTGGTVEEKPAIVYTYSLSVNDQ